MTTIRTFTVIAATTLALLTGSVAFADNPPKPAADKKPSAGAAPAAPAAGDKAAPAPAKKEQLSDAAAQKFVVFFDKLATIVVTNKDDCAKMASGINAHIDANQALLKDANDARNQNKELPPAIKDKIEKKFKDEIVPAITKKCGNDKPVQTAFMRMAPSSQPAR